MHLAHLDYRSVGCFADFEAEPHLLARCFRGLAVFFAAAWSGW